MNYNASRVGNRGGREIFPRFDSEGVARRIAAGDSRAEEELIVRFQPAIRAFLTARARPDFVDEVTQETMIAVICAVRAGKLREPNSLGAYIYGVAKVQLADAARRHVRHVGDPMPENYDHPAPQSEPELIAAARREIDALGETDRQIISMILIDGFRAGEVADRLGMSADLVRKRKSRALQRITERLAGKSRFASSAPLTSVKAIDR